jgi:hypothetical protein
MALICIRRADSFQEAHFNILQNTSLSETHGKNNWQHDPTQLSSTVLRDAQDTEDIDEEVDEIEIEANRSHNVLVRGEAAVDEVRIIDDISTEY